MTGDSRWAVTWRAIIVPLLAPQPLHTWWQDDALSGRRRVCLSPSMDAADVHKKPRKTTT